MNILDQLQKLDDLIAEHTRPPAVGILRAQLTFCTEQAEAHSTAVERQAKTLAQQIETIARLTKENNDLVAEIARRNAAVDKEQGFCFAERSR